MTDPTTDRVLDRVPHFDPRSRAFPIRPLLTGPAQRRKRVWTAGRPLDQRREGACFPAGTFVRLADGSQRRIEDVRVLDQVVTAEGRTGTVVQTMARRATELVEVHLRGHVKVRCTPEHPFLTDRGYVAARDLTPQHNVAVTRYHSSDADPLDVDALVDLRDLRGVIAGTVYSGGVLSDVAPLPSLLGKTPALGRLLGLYAAEGNTTPNKVTWSFGATERDTLVAETVALVKTVCDAQARVQVRPNGALQVVLYGKTWRRLFETLVPGTTRHGDKRLSGHVTAGPAEYLEALWRGWMDGDGHRRRSSIQGVSVSRNLALDMHAIANALGHMPGLRQSAPVMNRHATTRQERYDVTVSFGGGSNSGPRQDGGATWRRGATIRPLAFDGWVFNLHVEGDESYVADGLGVHNCVGFGWAAELAATPVPYGGVDDGYARSLYAQAQAQDRAMGNHWAEGASVLAGAKACRQAGTVIGYRWAFGVDDVIDTLVRKGPVVLGVNWHESMFQPTPNGLLTVAGPVLGGHCLLARGYWPGHPMFGDVVVLRNSWGDDWGVRGDAFLPVAGLAQLLAEDGEACVPTDFRPPTPAIAA